MGTELDQVRLAALHQAAHDLRGNDPPETVVARAEVYLKFLDPPQPMTDNDINHMVNRFLSWRLPEHFRPDAGISFKADFNEHTAHPMKHEPTGTNLFNWTQARSMVLHMLGVEPGQDPVNPFRHWRPVEMTNDQFVEHLRSVFPLATDEKLQELAITIGPGQSFMTTAPHDLSKVGA